MGIISNRMVIKSIFTGIYTYFLAICCCGLLFLSCNKSTQIRGIIEDYNHSEFKSKIYLIDPISFEGLMAPYQGKILDSTKITSDGRFIFKNLVVEETRLLELVLHKKESKFLTQLEMDNPLSSNYIPLVIIKNEDIEIKTKAENVLDSYMLNHPSSVNKEIIKLKQDYLLAYRKHLYDLEEVSEENLMEQEEAKIEFKRDLMRSISNCTEVYPILIGLKWMSKESDYERTPEFVFEQCDRLKKMAPQSKYVQDFCFKVSRDKLPLMIGDNMKDYLFPMQNKSEKKIGDLLGKKVTIIDLWASWCGPCRNENKNILVPLWDKYHQQGLQIVGYGLESNEITWIRAIDKDGANRWLHASHLNGDDSPLFQKWKISTIPANYILNAEGKIIAKNLYGEALKRFIGDYLKT